MSLQLSGLFPHWVSVTYVDTDLGFRVKGYRASREAGPGTCVVCVLVAESCCSDASGFLGWKDFPKVRDQELL